MLTHSVANELSFSPDAKPGTRIFLDRARVLAGDLDPTIPISVDTKGRPGYGEQFTYERFELLGVNQYFGWYRWVANFDDLEPFIYEQRDHYPKTAIVMTEFGAEALPEHAADPVTRRGSYAFQTFHALRTLDVVDRSPVLSGAIYWTLRESTRASLPRGAHIVGRQALPSCSLAKMLPDGYWQLRTCKTDAKAGHKTSIGPKVTGWIKSTVKALGTRGGRGRSRKDRDSSGAGFSRRRPSPLRREYLRGAFSTLEVADKATMSALLTRFAVGDFVGGPPSF